MTQRILTFNTCMGLDEIIIEESVTKPIILMAKDRLILGEKQRYHLEQDSLEEALKEHEFEVIFLTQGSFTPPWTRDIYTYDDGIYIPATDFGSLGAGGNVIYGNSFVLISKAAAHQDFTPELAEMIFPGKKVYFIRWLRKYSFDDEDGLPFLTSETGHIDPTIGSVPWRNLLTVDVRHYQQERETFIRLEGEHGVTIKPIEEVNEETMNLWGNNYLTIEEGIPSPIVFANISSQFLIRELRGSGVNVQTPKLPMVQTSSHHGGIRCLTNLAYSHTIIEYIQAKYGLKIFDREPILIHL